MKEKTQSYNLQDGMYVHILGCGSAKPSLAHNPSAQLLRLREKTFLIDCGEGVQTQILRYKVPMGALHRIFISHLHGDHCLGLPGLLSTMSLQKLNYPVHIYGPKGIVEFVEFIQNMFCPDADARWIAHEVDHRQGSNVYQDRTISIDAIPLKHRTPTVGYVFREQPLARKLNRAQADFYGVPISQFNNIKAGQDFITPDGELIPNSKLTLAPRAPYSYAYISDTAYLPKICPAIKHVDLLYHESTFEKALSERAKQTLHSTTEDAARIAQEAEVGTLCIGHYSARYATNSDIKMLLNEATNIFPNTLAANEGLFLDLAALRAEHSEKTI